MYFWYQMTHENREVQTGSAETEPRAPADPDPLLPKDARIVFHLWCGNWDLP